MRQNNNVRLERYSTASIQQNWRVFVNEQHVGDVHNCDGSIGGHIGELTETSVFDDVCAMAKADTSNPGPDFFEFIDRLKSVCHELGPTKEFVFLKIETTQALQAQMIEIDMENMDRSSMRELLATGITGYDDYSNLDLIIRRFDDIASQAYADHSDLLDYCYDIDLTVKTECEQFIADEIAKIILK